MTAASTLEHIARGERPAGLLQTCRLLAGGFEHYGIEAVAAQFRLSPLDFAAASVVSDGDTVAALWDDTALIADAYGPNIARIWRIGPGHAVRCEPRIDVPFDADMAQARGSVRADPTDLPRLEPGDVDRLAEAIQPDLDRWTIGGAPTSRARAFVLRGIAADAMLVGLFAVHALALSDRKTAGFAHAVVVIGADGARIVRDCSGEASAAAREWSPRAA